MQAGHKRVLDLFHNEQSMCATTEMNTPYGTVHCTLCKCSS